jgi:trehalose/maltose hydrolase-like predicted phosphorylase
MPLYNDSDSDYDSDTDSDSDSSEVDETIEGVQDLYNDEYEAMTINIPHKMIRNYSNIVRHENYIQPQIALCIELPTGENITIIKTIWIKLIQRAWKRVYKRRQSVINGRTMIESLNCRRLTGNWPEMYREMPGIKCLLK